jgi:succinate dehydrogenase / fumarate reductase iron-sulfur subunit
MMMSEQPILLKIFRYNPDEDHMPTYQSYEVPWKEGLLLLSALKYIRETLDETLAFRDYCCQAGWCTSCMMTVNGKGMRACLKTLKPGDELTVEPMKGFPVIKDLVVDYGVKVATPHGVFKRMEGTLLKKTQ